MAGTVRVSELPVATVLNDDDFIIVNTQNIVTQGIETEDFLESVFGRNLEFTGTPNFSGGANFDGALTIDGTVTLNNNITINGDFTLNGTTSVKLGQLSDVDTTGATAGQILAYNAGAQTWVVTDESGGDPAGNNRTLQFNDNGKFGSASNIKFDTTTSGVSGLIVDGGGYGDIELVPNATGGTIKGTQKLQLIALSDLDISAGTNLKLKIGNATHLTLSSSGLNIDVSTTVSELTTDKLTAGGIVYPQADGTVGQVLTTDGNGNLSFQTNSATGGTNIPFQASPPLGSNTGELWINSTNYKLYVWDGSWIDVN